MSDLTRFADHCRAMATAEHKPECPDPKCPGCVTDDDRALWTTLAAEVDDYLDPHPTLWGDQ